MKSLNLAATALTMSFVAGAALAQPATGTMAPAHEPMGMEHASEGAVVSKTEVTKEVKTEKTHKAGEHKDHKDHKAKKEAK